MLNRIQKEIQEIKQLTNEFTDVSSIPVIEIDICLDKVKRLYEDIISLKTGDSFIDTVKNEDEYIDSFDVNDSISEDEVDLGIESEEIAEETPLKDTGEMDRAEETSVPKAGLHVQEKTETENRQISDKHAKKLINKNNKNAGEVVADKIKPKRQSINDMIAQNKFDKDISSKFKSSQISDINKAININDRVWFIKELFKGDAQLYKTTVDKLNKSADLDSAINFIKESFDWDSNEKVVEKFVRIVSRRFV